MADTKLSSPVEDKWEAPCHWEVVDQKEGPPTQSWARALFSKRKTPRLSADDIATKPSVFDDPHLGPFYWPKQGYENMHRFDPSARWTYREERALVRKIDWKIMFMIVVCFSALNLDAGNINLANSDNFLSDLHLTTDDYNLGNTISRLAFLCADLPSQLISKRMGPDRWLPMQICLWSVLSLCQFWLKGRTSFLACRALLGLLQGGFSPNMILYMSYFYTKNELPIRLGALWISMFFCGIATSFMAYGIFHLDGVAGQAGWRWLFLIDGLITFSIGAASFFNMPPSPTQTKTWFRPNGWFTDREEVVIVNRILRDDPTKGDMHNREGLTPKRIWTAMCDYDLWPLYVLGLVLGIPGYPPSTYLTLLLRGAGFSILDTNLLTIPHQVLGSITTFLMTFLTEMVDERTFVAMIEDVWMLPFLVAVYALPPSANPWLRFGMLAGILSHPFTHPIQIAWCSRNAGAVATRAVTTTLYNMFSQASGIVAAQIYVASDAPRYERGNRILIVICAINVFVLYPGTKMYYIWRNRQRAQMWDAMTSEEKAHYLKTTKDIGNRRLDFRFAH